MMVPCWVAADQSWWNGLTPVDQNSQTNINTLVTVTEDIKMTEVNAWADASRRNEQLDDQHDRAEALPETQSDSQHPLFDD